MSEVNKMNDFSKEDIESFIDYAISASGNSIPESEKLDNDQKKQLKKNLSKQLIQNIDSIQNSIQESYKGFEKTGDQSAFIEQFMSSIMPIISTMNQNLLNDISEKSEN